MYYEYTVEYRRLNGAIKSELTVIYCEIVDITDRSNQIPIFVFLNVVKCKSIAHKLT